MMVCWYKLSINYLLRKWSTKQSLHWLLSSVTLKPSRSKERMTHHQLLPIPQPQDTTELMRTMLWTISLTTTPSQSPTLLVKPPDKRSSTEMDAKRPVLKSSSSLNKFQKPRWKHIWVNSSQEPGLSSTLITPEKSISPNPTPSWDLLWEDLINSSSPQDHSPTSAYELSIRD